MEVNRFVIEPDFQRRGGLQARFRVFERGVDMALETGAKGIIVAVRPEHVKFYRMLYGTPVSESKVYHHVKFKTVLVVCTEIERCKEFLVSKLYGIKDESTFNYGVN
jgi:N-acyl-L-homoserine lactone synthetase